MAWWDKDLHGLHQLLCDLDLDKLNGVSLQLIISYPDNWTSQ
uniref:Uncharacterized protein n=1 Tax=Rhizophora mucronata TaxID=61149 RepID=A0A2P2NWV6_RHIMU